MGPKIYVLCLSILLHFLSSSLVFGDQISVVINGGASIAEIDEYFICATLDWWPPEKCDYGTCSWGHASLLNLDLNNEILFKAVRAFSHLKIRLGGSLQDKVIYESEDAKDSCTPFTKSSEMFGFTSGCLPMKRWDELNAFFKQTGVLVVFGLNALNGRTIQPDGTAIGAWDPSNAQYLIRYTVDKGYDILGWELGNELSGNGVGARVSASQYASDIIILKKVVEEIYSSKQGKPLVMAPGGFFQQDWYSEFVNKAQFSVDVLSHHIYNLGPGSNPNLIQNILNPLSLDSAVGAFRDLEHLIKASRTSAVAWMSEAGGAYNSGRNHVTNTFVFSFWYLDELGMASKYDTKTYCRQSLIGGNYGLLNTTTFVPNPDYYSALLWHKLMGRNVLSTSSTGTNKIRAYAHCSKQSQGITLMLINLDGNTAIEVDVRITGIGPSPINSQEIQGPNNIREEYHLTAKDGELQSQTMLLNGQPLTLTLYGDIPDFTPKLVVSTEPLVIQPFSILFVHMPSILVPACF